MNVRACGRAQPRAHANTFSPVVCKMLYYIFGFGQIKGKATCILVEVFEFILDAIIICSQSYL